MTANENAPVMGATMAGAANQHRAGEDSITSIPDAGNKCNSKSGVLL